MDIKELHSFNLSDAVKFHDQLNPKLFKNDKLDPKVRKQLLIIAQDFMEELGISGLNVKDITLSGSNAAYSYTKHSDCDLHILIDMAKLPEDEVYRELFNAKKTLYNDSHDIEVHGIPVELYVQDTNQKHVSLGEYSILNDDWISFPKKRKATLDITNSKLKFSKLFDIITLALKSGDLVKIDPLLHLIKRYRQAGLDQGGELSPENLAYKALRSRGLIQKLFDARAKLHSKDLSIENVNEVTRYFPRIKYLRPSELRGSYTDNQLTALGFKKSEKGTWYIPQSDWDRLVKNNSISEEEQLAERLAIELEDYDPNGPPPGPEFKPTMPAGTVKVDVSDVYDWYKLGQHISNLKGLGKHDFGKGPPSTILSFGDEDVEHQYIKDLEKTGLSTTDIDPVDPKQPKGMKRQKVDPTYNVNEDENTNKLAWRINFGDKFKELSSLIPEREGKIYLMPLDYSALETFGNLTGEEPDQINRMPSQVYAVSGDALVGDMSIINEIVNALHYMEINKSNLPLKQQYQSHIAKLKKRYVDSRVPYNQYRPGKFEMPEILAEPSQLHKSDTSIRYNNKTDRIEIKDEKKLDHTYKVTESEQLFEVNFNDPKLIDDALNADIYCGFEAETVWNQTPVMSDPWEEITGWYELNYLLNARATRKAAELYATWLDNHPKLNTYLTQVEKEYMSDYLDEDEQKIQFFNEIYPDRIGLSDEDKIEIVDNDNSEYKIWILSKQFEEFDSYSEAIDRMKRYYSMDDFINDVYDGNYQDFAENALNFYLDSDAESRNDQGSISVVATDLSPWINSSSRFKSYQSGTYRSTNAANPTIWRIEPDSSIQPDDPNEQVGAEIISPVYDTPNSMLSEMDSLFKYFRNNDVTTNESTGLHVTMSYPQALGSPNKLKMAVLLGEPYLLKMFDRLENTYTQSQLQRLKDAAMLLDDSNNLREVERLLIPAIGSAKYSSINFKSNGHVEFRIAGNEDYEKRMPEIKKTVARYAIIMLAGFDGTYLLKDYYTALGRLVKSTFKFGSGDILQNSFLNVYNKLLRSAVNRVDPEDYPIFMNLKTATPLDKSRAKGAFTDFIDRLSSQESNRLPAVSDADARIIRTTARELGYTSIDQIIDDMIIPDYRKEDTYDNLDKIFKTKVKRESIAESEKVDFRESVLNEFVAYHGTFKPSLARFKPLSHFGTNRAATERLHNVKTRNPKFAKATKGYVYELDLGITAPGKVKDYPDIIDPSPASMKKIAAWSKDLLKDTRFSNYTGTNPINGNSNINGKEILKHFAALAESGYWADIPYTKFISLWINFLLDVGVDGLEYANQVEHNRSKSFIIFNPDQVKVKRKKVIDLTKNVTQDVTEATKSITLGPQLYVSRKKELEESLKPNAALWTSTAKDSSNGYTSDWVEWCKEEMPQWITDEGILYDVAPGARILNISTDKDVMRIAKKYGIEVKDSMELFMKMRWEMLAKDYDAIHHTLPPNRYDNLFMSAWDVESTAWFNTTFLVNPRKVKVDSGEVAELEESASGYIPSEKEKNDPRFKSALTVDIKPDTLQKNAKKLGWKINKAGISPLLRK